MTLEIINTIMGSIEPGLDGVIRSLGGPPEGVSSKNIRFAYMEVHQTISVTVTFSKDKCLQMCYAFSGELLAATMVGPKSIKPLSLE